MSVVLAGGQVERHWVHWGFLIGIVLAWLLYLRGFLITRLLLRVPLVKWIYHWLLHGMYFDELYLAVVVGVVRTLASACDWFDRKVVDGSPGRAIAFARRAGRLVGPRR